MPTIKDAFFRYTNTDKLKYLDFYSRHFSSLNPSCILEIGVLHGDSLNIWKSVFPKAKVVGIDVDSSLPDKFPKFEIFIGDQRDKRFLKSVLDTIGIPDIVIDDGGHTRTCQVKSLEYLFPRLNPRSLYIIEDIETSYLPEYSDSEVSCIDLLKSWLVPTNFTTLDNPPPARVFNYVASSITFEPNICILRK